MSEIAPLIQKGALCFGETSAFLWCCLVVSTLWPQGPSPSFPVPIVHPSEVPVVWQMDSPYSILKCALGVSSSVCHILPHSGIAGCQSAETHRLEDQAELFSSLPLNSETLMPIFFLYQGAPGIAVAGMKVGRHCRSMYSGQSMMRPRSWGAGV